MKDNSLSSSSIRVYVMVSHDFIFFTRVVKMGGDLMAQWVLRIAQILE